MTALFYWAKDVFTTELCSSVLCTGHLSAISNSLARRKKWPLTHVYVDVTHNKVLAQDAETRNAKVDQFNREIHLEGELSDEQRAKLLEIADKCPVHKTLEQSSVVKTSLAK